MTKPLLIHLKQEIDQLKTAGLYKQERTFTSPQSAAITLSNGKQVLNFCSNNYLGLANNTDIIESAKQSYSKYGFGVASVRFICGKQTVHEELEHRLSQFLHTEDTILFSSCFDANGGVFEPLFGAEDAIISDSLNHASIIDGIRLCKAKRLRYENNNMEDLENQLKSAQDSRFRIIATDGVFSMDGIIANLKAICDLADRYNALVMVDDCHATGFMGKSGIGTPDYCEVLGRVDILTGTLGKALGGASGGYVSGRKEIIEWLRQRARPYLFSNSLCPSIAAATLTVLNLIEAGHALRDHLHENARLFRKGMHVLGFELAGKDHPIIPVMLGDAALAGKFAAKMLDHGVYVVGFSYPVVPMGKARIRTQVSAAHSRENIVQAINAFAEVGREMGVIK